MSKMYKNAKIVIFCGISWKSLISRKAVYFVARVAAA